MNEKIFTIKSVYPEAEVFLAGDLLKLELIILLLQLVYLINVLQLVYLINVLPFV